MPALPEKDNIFLEIRFIEIFGYSNSEKPSQPDGNIAVT
jgi:hypothetical protein